MNKLLTSHEQVPTVVIIRLETGKTTIPGVGCWCRFPTVVRIRLSQPSLAGSGLARAWAELGNNGGKCLFCGTRYIGRVQDLLIIF